MQMQQDFRTCPRDVQEILTVEEEAEKLLKEMEEADFVYLMRNTREDSRK